MQIIDDIFGGSWESGWFKFLNVYMPKSMTELIDDLNRFKIIYKWQI